MNALPRSRTHINSTTENPVFPMGVVGEELVIRILAVGNVIFTVREVEVFFF